MNVFDALLLKANGEITRQEFRDNFRKEMFGNTHNIDDFEYYIY